MFKQSKSVRPNTKQNNFLELDSQKLQSSRYKDEAKQMILDYLAMNGYTKSLDVFKSQNKQKKGGTSEIDKITYFLNSSNRIEFFNRLNKEISKEVRDNDQTFRRLQFFLHIYFLVMTRKQKSFDQGAMEAFKTLLEAKGKYLSQFKQFLPYFALPFIKDPTSHPATISHIFKQEWLNQIKKETTHYLQEVIQDFKQSKLQIFLKKDGWKGNTASFEASPSREQQLLQIIKQSSQHYQQLQSNYKQMIEAVKQNLVQSQAKWFNLAKQIILISKKFIRVVQNNNLVTGQMSNMIQKIKKYEVFLNNSVDDVISNSISVSVFDQPTYDDIQNQSISRNITKRKSSINMLSLNYVKIKQSLLEEKQINVCLLLQALRWKITKTSSAYARREIIMGYTVNDIFKIKEDKQQILEKLLSLNTSELIKQQSLRLINAIESDFYGRSYMLENNFLLEKLVDTLKSQSYDGTIRRLTLNALQKLSLRPQAQLYTISEGIIHWIVQTIKLEKDQLSDISFEYLTALLMNMTLKRAGRQQCQKQNMLQLLVDLLMIQSNQVRTYVCGSIYSLLSSKKMRQEAKRIGMLQQLKRFKNEGCPVQFSKQLAYIITEMENKQTIINESVLEDDSQENDADDLQQQEDDDNQEQFDDQIDGTKRMDKGQQLLLKKYSCVGPDALRQQYLTRSILDDAIKNSFQVSMIREKKSSRQQKSSIPVRSTLELIDAIDQRQRNPIQKQNTSIQPSILVQQDNNKSISQAYISSDYIPKYKSFRKKNLVKSSNLSSQQYIESPQIQKKK